MQRRKFIQATGASLAAVLLHKPFAAIAGNEEYATDIAFPTSVSALVNGETVQLTGSGKQ